MAAVKEINPDLVFLDIEMPGMSGFEWLNQCEQQNFEVVFTTAYNEYAIRAIKHSALDYLLKPVDKDELIQA
nr:response regulator [Chitinophagaceae bacterium]